MIMKTLKMIFLLLYMPWASSSQDNVVGLVNASVDSNGEWVITASENSSSDDFNFLTGKWNVLNRRLKNRLSNSKDWFEFESTVENRSFLLGIANVDISKTSYTGSLHESVSLRIFNPQTRLWSLYWADSRKGVMDPAVVGSFDEDVGLFYGKNVFNDIPVLVVFKWDKTDPQRPEWSQAYSADNGKTWEWNSLNVSRRILTDTLPAPESFMKEIVSTDSLEFGSAFSPDGNAFYFSRSVNKKARIFLCRKQGEGWTRPEPASFSNGNWRIVFYFYQADD